MKRSTRRGGLVLTSLGAAAVVLLLLAGLSGAAVNADGTFSVPFPLLAGITLLATGAGSAGLIRLFRDLHRTSRCGRGSC